MCIQSIPRICPMSHRGSTSWDPNHWALRSREQRRTTSLRSVSKGEWKVLELCTFCLLQIRPKVRERTGVPRTATFGAKKETMSLSGKRKHRTFDSLPSKTYSPPYKSRPNYQSLKKSLGTNNPETRRMYDYIRVLEKRGMWLATLW